MVAMKTAEPNLSIMFHQGNIKPTVFVGHVGLTAAATLWRVCRSVKEKTKSGCL